MEQRTAVCAELAAAGQPVAGLTTEEWAMAEAYVQILQPFHHATKAVGEDGYPTKALEIPILHGIEKHLLKSINSKAKGITLARALYKSVKSRFPFYKQDHIRLVAMVVDPRFKNALLDNVGKERVKSILFSEVNKHLKVFEGETPQSVQTPPAPENDVLFSDIDNLQHEPEGSREDKINFQISTYLNMRCIPRSECTATWWRKHDEEFNFLMPVVKHYLPIPASSISSERLFSTAGNIVTERRKRLLTKHVSQLVFLHENVSY